MATTIKTDLLIKALNSLFNTRAAGLYILVFALAIATATFVENDFGTSSAQKVIYQSGWFTGLLTLICLTIVVNIFRFRMIQQKKWALLLFHAAIIVILLGAAVTRYFGFEGIMHIRKNETSNSFLSSETYLQFKAIKDQQVYDFDEQVLFASIGNNHWNGFYRIGNDLVKVKVIDFIPNPTQDLRTTRKGKPTLKVVTGGSHGREESFLSYGETIRINNSILSFSSDTIAHDINIGLRNDSLVIHSKQPLIQRVMATQQIDTLNPRPVYYPLKQKSLYTIGNSSFVIADFNPKGEVFVRSEDAKVKSESMIALKMSVQINDKTDTLLVYGAKGIHGRTVATSHDGLDLYISYGSKHIPLPFSIKLHQFTMERYPGTDNAASYASDVQLIDVRNNISQDYRIYMNHILNYEGYRFFQSSFDNDENGTYLSVNHDRWGSIISYLGYGLLTVGMILSLVSRKSRFYQLSKNLEKIRSQIPAVRLIAILGLVMPINGSAQKTIGIGDMQSVVQEDHARNFSEIVVQDQNGRMKPMHTLSREVLRKLARTESIDGISADEIVLSMFARSQDWVNVNMITIGSHPSIRKLIGVQGNLASYADFFDANGDYLLDNEVRKAYNMQPVDRGAYEKELMKIDERVNIANMIYSGSIFKIIPMPNDPNNEWVANVAHHHHESDHHQHQSDASRFFIAYRNALNEAIASHDYSAADKLIAELDQYQKQNGFKVIPPESKINAEILLNKLNLFNRLAVFYTIVGLSLLFILFYSVFRTVPRLHTWQKILFAAIVGGFIVHTAGLALRWYVSGRAPWSNGYESMIYIAWTAMLSGMLFARKSIGGLAATMIISATVLLVAMLSYLDPEITPLVPVLKSYWLTIHVSMEAGSYGFLMLGALIGFINLILMVSLTSKNKERVYQQIKEMSYLSEMTLIGGVIMISIGTYLGGVWANESWGRYWGWDAKETWALVTILIYAFILHMRIIPKLQGLFAYNFATIFGLASVIMTYYGVNYYLSGLHSYAAGDPVPLPKWVFASVMIVIVITALAFRKKRIYNIST
jgi:cytochrome c-type biogenesis protein CcsB